MADTMATDAPPSRGPDWTGVRIPDGMVQAPARCRRCRTNFASPTTGLLGERCGCGGVLDHIDEPVIGGMVARPRFAMVDIDPESELPVRLVVDGVTYAWTSDDARSLYADLGKVIGAAPASADVDRAIEVVEFSRSTHVQWLEYVRDYPEQAAQPEARVDVAGDTEHHTRCIEGYDHVLSVLRSLRTGERAV